MMGSRNKDKKQTLARGRFLFFLSMAGRASKFLLHHFPLPDGPTHVRPHPAHRKTLKQSNC